MISSLAFICALPEPDTCTEDLIVIRSSALKLPDPDTLTLELSALPESLMLPDPETRVSKVFVSTFPFISPEPLTRSLKELAVMPSSKFAVLRPEVLRPLISFTVTKTCILI
jgi:hypothetical protein